MSERVLNQAVYSLIKELGVWTDRRVKGGVRCKCEHGEKCEHSAKCKHGAKCKCGPKCKCGAKVQVWGWSVSVSMRQRYKVRCVRWGVFCLSLFTCMYRWYKYKGYGRCRCCSANTIDCMISSKTNGVHKRGSWSGDRLWDNGDISCGLLIVWWDNACDLMSLPRPGHRKPRRVMWGMKGAVKWGACMLHLKPMTRMIKCL